MSSRAASELLLVGSLPAQSTDEAFRAGAELFGDLVFALPDGETGPRAAWVGYERERLVRPNPDVEVVEETDSPTGIPSSSALHIIPCDSTPRSLPTLILKSGPSTAPGRASGTLSPTL